MIEVLPRMIKKMVPVKTIMEMTNTTVSSNAGRANVWSVGWAERLLLTEGFSRTLSGTLTEGLRARSAWEGGRGRSERGLLGSSSGCCEIWAICSGGIRDSSEGRGVGGGTGFPACSIRCGTTGGFQGRFSEAGGLLLREAGGGCWMEGISF